MDTQITLGLVLSSLPSRQPGEDKQGESRWASRENLFVFLEAKVSPQSISISA